GFIPDIERIFGLVPFTRQTLFFSATMAPEIERITNTFLHAPARIEVARQATTSETIEQAVVRFKPSRRDRAATEKRNLLRALIDSEGEACTNAIIFCNRKTDVDIVAKSLKKYGYNAEPIHGDLDQSKRMEVLQGFRDGAIRFLCASDVAARGLDIPNVSHIFNYDVPGHAEDYVHRIGRTGRAGRSGKAFMLCEPRDEKNLDAVERLIEREIPRVDDPLKGDRAAEAESASDADEAPRSARKGGRDSSRAAGRDSGRSNSRGRSRATTEDESQPEETVQAAPEPRQAEEVEDKPSAPRSRSRSSGRKGRGDDVVGMGDHLPQFIAQSFDERRD
ncbi:MAG: DEAD/DEAH box helicase, partial [Maritimibacter sp.]|nr:DEAD/DEAH box helicase [Maritimibacter sp.]